MNLNSLRSLECSVCLQPFINPVKLPCGHSFCFLCVKGVANVSHNCALCRKPFPRELIDKPNVLALELRDDESLSSATSTLRHVWYYEGRNGWWMYDQRTNDEIDQSFRRGDRRLEILVVGQLYVIDFENMHQYRLNDTQRRRRIKYDLMSAPKKGVGGLKLDRQRNTQYNPPITDAPVVPSLASSVPSIIANSSSSDHSVVIRSRSDADGEEPTSLPSVVVSQDDTNRTAIRQPADGLGNSNTTTTWQTNNNNNNDEHRVTSWSSDDDDDDDDEVPPSSRLRPVLIGGEDDTQHHHSNDEDISRSRYTRISPEPQSITTTNQSLLPDSSHTSQSFTMTDNKLNQVVSTVLDLNSLPDQTKMTHNHFQTPNAVDQQKFHLSDSLNDINEDNDINSLNKNNLLTSNLDPFECKKQTILSKAEAKLEKAQHLHQLAQHNIEQSISEFLRATTIPSIINESNSSKTIIATFEKRIRTLQEAKKRLEKKITKYQNDIIRIQAGDIPQHYKSTKDILTNIKNKVLNENDKNHSIHNTSTSAVNEQTISSNSQEHDNQHYTQFNFSSTLPNHNIDTMNNNQNISTFSHNSNAFETKRSSPSSSISNEIGNSSSYIDSNSDISAINSIDRSPTTKRRFTDDSNIEFNDQISDYSNDDRFASCTTSKRNTITITEYYHLTGKVDSIQKIIDRYDTKMIEMQKQMDSLILINNSQNERNERLNNELTDLTDLHQNEMSTIKTDLRKLEEKLLYNLNEYWTEIIERLDKLDTRTTKVEQTQAHSFETEENTHRIISKLVNILLTVFAIILLLLSTIKNLVQSRVHAIILLILVFTWIIIRYLPENYFQISVFKNFTNIFQ
ncbi:unnamed protein product [Rotaria sordida]|uniref:E3 ubiquitin-protein ligase n=1 Tax=Rotaria sordida TaxID=392033 RepID=A0A814BXS5_9BILA|nr:unnamed protein product [Rotaria sordida]